MDYFIKWAEAETLANIRDVDVKKFVLRNIVTIFGCWTPSYLLMGCNSIIKHFASFVMISALRTRIPSWHILRVTAKLKPSI